MCVIISRLYLSKFSLKLKQLHGDRKQLTSRYTELRSLFNIKYEELAI